MSEEFQVPQLHREEHVLTQNDLVAIRNGYVYQWYKASRWNLYKRFKFLVGIGVIDALIDFLLHGKLGKELI